jgi:hypothetical protein
MISKSSKEPRITCLLTNHQPLAANHCGAPAHHFTQLIAAMLTEGRAPTKTGKDGWQHTTVSRIRNRAQLAATS